jgi:DNA-binding response OmpR family regulator
VQDDADGLDGIRVMLVEDEDLIAMMVEEFLNDLGCRLIGTAARLDDALAMAGMLEVDVAVLDVNLAGKLSYPVAELLQARGISFIFATGYGVAGLPDKLRGTVVLSKPFTTDQLGAALRSAIRDA